MSKSLIFLTEPTLSYTIPGTTTTNEKQQAKRCGWRMNDSDGDY
jgi:hypothetical protein